MSAKTVVEKPQQRSAYEGSKHRRKRRAGGEDGAVKKFDNNSEICLAFQSFQTELDTKYARHERLVKLSRDVTIDSKKTISMLQRVVGCEEVEAQTLLEQAADKLREIRHAKFRLIAGELQREEPHQFLRAYSPGVQEYVEAVTLLHYLRDGTLVGLKEICQDLSFPADSESDPTSDTGQSPPTQSPIVSPDDDTSDTTPAARTLSVFVSPEDYILGVADLTGELMRIAINSISAGDMDLPFKLCSFIRNIYDSFLAFENLSRELSRKLFVLRQSLKKVETACYTIQVRGSEIPTHLLADAIISDSAPIANEPSEGLEH